MGLRNLGLVVSASDLDENGELKPGAGKGWDTKLPFPFSNDGDLECGDEILLRGRKPSKDLAEQLAALCEMKGSKKG